MYKKMVVKRLQWTIYSGPTVLMYINQVLSWETWNLVQVLTNMNPCASLEVHEINTFHKWIIFLFCFVFSSISTSLSQRAWFTGEKKVFFSRLNQTNKQQTGHSLLAGAATSRQLAACLPRMWRSCHFVVHNGPFSSSGMPRFLSPARVQL